MNGRIPDFSDNDLRWIRADELRARLGIKHAQFQRLHRSFGTPFEFRGDGKPGTPVWVFFPGWIAARIRFEAPEKQAATKEDHEERLKKIKANREELRYQKELELLLHISDATSDVELFAATVRRGIESLSPDGREIMLEAINEAEAEWMRQHGNQVQRANGCDERQMGSVATPDPPGSPL